MESICSTGNSSWKPTEYILELPAEQNTVELRIVSKGVQEFGIGGYPMSGLGEYKVEGFTIKVTPDPASEKLETYELHRCRIQRRTAPYSTLSPNASSRRRHEHRTAKGDPDTVHHEHSELLDGVESTHRPAGGQVKEKESCDSFFSCCKQIVPDLFVESFLRLLASTEPGASAALHPP